MTILIPGRFQPFHSGHAWLWQEAVEGGRGAILVVCAAEDQRTATNPWTAGERIAMISAGLARLDEEGARRTLIIPARDIHDPPNWVAHIDRLVPEYQEVHSGNAETLALFSAAGHPIHQVDLVGDGWTGTAIRRALSEGADPAGLPLPSGVVVWLAEHGGWPLD